MDKTMPEHLPAPEDQMMQWITAKWITKPIYVAAELGLADHLVAGPLSVDALAGKTETHAPTLYRLLRALSGRGNQVLSMPSASRHLNGWKQTPRLGPPWIRARGVKRRDSPKR